MPAGFDGASENLGAAHQGHTANRGPAPAACLQVLQKCTSTGGCPLPTLSRRGRRAQPPGIPGGCRSLDANERRRGHEFTACCYFHARIQQQQQDVTMPQDDIWRVNTRRALGASPRRFWTAMSCCTETLTWSRSNCHSVRSEPSAVCWAMRDFACSAAVPESSATILPMSSVVLMSCSRD